MKLLTSLKTEYSLQVNSLNAMSTLKVHLVLAVMLFSISAVYSQTVIIDPATDGGFENGFGGFVNNGWTTANSANNTWQCIDVGNPFEGSNHAFISNDGGNSYGYNNTIATANYFYKDVTVPAGESIMILNFMLKNVGEAGWDRIAVFAAPTTVIPTAGVPAPNSLALAGATLVFTDAAANGIYHTSGDVSIPSSFAGTTFRLMFLWSSDTAGGTSPGGAVDNISLTSAVPALFTTTTYGGLWNSPETWVGGVVPANGNDVLVPAGSTLTMNATRAVNNITIDGDLNWNATVPSPTVNFLTVSNDITIGATGRVFAHNAAAAPAGAAIFLGHTFTNNGWANFAYSNASILASNTTSNITISGSGSFAGDILHQLFLQTTGNCEINTDSNITIRAFAMAAGTINTNGKLSIDNTAQYYGTAANQSVYEIVVTNHGEGYTSAPIVYLATTPIGTNATAVANMDLASGTLRSITVTVAGSGYRVGAPAVTLSGGGFTTAATAVAVVPLAAAGTVNSLTQKSAVAVITGGINITSHQGVGSARTTAGGIGYTSAPTVGFTVPITYLNLVTAGGAGYTTAPTVTVSGGININAGTNPTFTVTVASGIVTGVQCTAAGTSSWTVLPTLTLTGGGGAGATCAFPTGCLPTASATISNLMVDNFTITNQGFGYTVAPTMALVGGGFSTAATAPTCNIGLYNLTLGFFTPAPVNAVHADDAAVPANRRINMLSMNSALGVQFTSNLELYASAPLILTTGAVNMGANTLSFGSLGYAGQNGSSTAFVEGEMVLRTVGGAVTRNVPFQGTLGLNPGTGSLTTGSTITTWTVNHTEAPTGTVNAPATSMTGSRGFRVRTNAGSIYGTNPVMTCGWTAIDGLMSDNPKLYVAQGTGGTNGPWTVRSASAGTGALAATGNRATATVAPGPFVGTGDDYLAFATSLVYTPMAYEVTRNTGITYTSIIGAGGESYGTIGAAGTSSDDQTYTAPLLGTTFQYAGSNVTSMTVSNNGFITFNDGTAGLYLNNMAATTKQISIFNDDLVSPGYSGVATSAFLAYKTVGLGTGTGTITVEWKGMETFGLPGPNLNFQIVLSESDNGIKFNYGIMQGFDGTVGAAGAVVYSYSCGLSNNYVNLVDPQPGMILQQQEENTRNFSAYGGTVASRGTNYLTTMPKCYSQIVFTPGTYTPYVAGSTVPINDNPAGAITLTPLPALPTDLCGAYFSSKGASATTYPAVFACSASNNNDDDVWFKFNAISTNTTIKVYSPGGGDHQVEVWNAALTAMLGSSCIAGEGTIETLNLTGLSLGVNYYVRVYHKQGGVQATATATITGGVVTAITMTNNGSGYINTSGAGPGARIPLVTINGGGGRNAVGGVVTYGQNTSPAGVTSITILNGGAGYVTPPTVTIAPPNAGITGDFAIAVIAAPDTPSNDDICGAINVVPAYACSLTPHFTTASATASPQAACAQFPDDDVWLQFTAESAQDRVQVNSGAGYNAVIEIFSSSDSSCTGTLTSIACVNATASAGIEIWQGSALVTGNTYFVRIYHAGAGAGSGSLSYCITTPPCANLEPLGLSQMNTGLTNFVVNWSDEATVISYDWELAVFGAAQGTNEVQNGNSGNNSIIALTGLTPNTYYTFYVRTNCWLGSNNWASLTVNTLLCPMAGCGCTDAGACNYDAGALYDDASCEYTSCIGCMDTTACNYDANALIQGECDYCSCDNPQCGCMDTGACNYNAQALYDNGLCDYSCAGCMDPGATNYDALATIEDGSCYVAGNGTICSAPIPIDCASGIVSNFTVSVTNDNAASQAMVCSNYISQGGQRWYVFESEFNTPMTIGTLNAYTNFNSLIKVFTGTCGDFTCVTSTLLSPNPVYQTLATFNAVAGTTYYIRVGGLNGEEGAYGLVLDCGGGCLDNTACNYDADAPFDDGSCLYNPDCNGCTDELAENFDPNATADDESCNYNGHILVFCDLNNNGTLEINEPGMANWPVNFPGLGVTFFTNNYGEISVPLAVGSYETHLINYLSYNVTTDTTQTLIVPSEMPIAYGVVPNEVNFSVTQNIAGPFHCTNGYYAGACIYNNGSSPITGVLTMTCDPMFLPEPYTSGDPPTISSPGYAEWNFTVNGPGVSPPRFHIDGPGVNFVGQSMYFNFHLELYNAANTLIYDEYWTNSPIVSCAYDPNDITAIPEGYESPHFILGDERLEYKIRFQNTGNAPAEDIVVINQLDPAVYDLSSFLPVTASSNMLTCLHDDGTIDFIFNDIYLADSVNNEPASHGFLIYQIELNQPLDEGTVASDFADIIFEQNPPITTNTVFHTIFNCNSLTGIVGESDLCLGESALLSAEQNYVESYNWSVDTNAVSNDASPAIDNLAVGTHDISVELINPLCTVQYETTVIVNPLPELNAGSDVEICAGDSITLNATSNGPITWSNGEANGTTYWPAQSETLTASSINTFNCTTTDEWNIVVNDLPGITILENGAELTAPNGTSWQWYLNGELIVGATEQVYIAATEGEFYVVTINSSNCSAQSTSVFISSVGEGNAFNVIVYPNPAHHSAIVVLPAGVFQIALYDQSGKLIENFGPQQSQFILERKSLAAGSYQLTISNDEKSSAVQIVLN